MSDDRLAYLEWSVDPDDYDPADPACWAQANPAIDRIGVEFIRAERAALPPDIFARERLGVPDPEPSESGDPAVDVAVWHGLADVRSKAGKVAAFGVDVSPDRRRCAVAVAGTRGDGLTHVEVVESGPMGAWLVPRLVDLHSRHGGVVVLEPGGAAASLVPDLSSVPVVAMSRRDVIAACGRFHDLVHERKLRHIDQTDLNVSVANAARRRVGDAFIWDRRLGVHTDLTPLYAVTLACWPQQSEPAKSIASF